MKKALLAAVAALALSACGTQMGDRMASGAAIGAGTGAVVGPVGVVGGAVAGAAVGAVAPEENVNLGDPVWDRDSNPSDGH